MSKMQIDKSKVDAIMGELSAEDRKILAAHMKGSKSRRVDEKTLMAKYPHVVEGTLSFDSVANKQFVQIACTFEGCDQTRKTFTSDIFQIKTCDAHRKEVTKAKLAAKSERIKELLAKASAK